MVFLLIFRNVMRNLPRLAPMVVVLVLSFAALVAGNGVLGTSDDALYRTYAAHVAGDLSVGATDLPGPGESGSPGGAGSFTIFGSDALLVGEYLVPPVIAGFDALRDHVDGRREVRATAAVVSAVARVEAAGRRGDMVLFGVDFPRYRALFPALELVAGRYPDPGERGVVLQAGWGGTAPDAEGAAALLGQRALLAVAHDITFTLREVPVTGIFRYPVEDAMLQRVALVDPDTARALNGYIYGSAAAVEISLEEQGFLESDLDDLFGAADQWDEELWDDDLWDEAQPGLDADFDYDFDYDVGTEGARDPLASLQQFFADTRDETEQARATVDGAWNFLLIGLHNRQDGPAVAAALERRGYTPREGFIVRDWRRTVGGTAQIVWYLQLLFNVGIIFVAFGAAVITTNALVLSVLERTAEIGTMRALGATRQRVALMITGETLVVVAGAAVVGILAGIGVTTALERAALVPQNQYLAILFGGQPIRGEITVGLVATHLLVALGLTAVAVVYPLKRALGISPVQAMAAA